MIHGSRTSMTPPPSSSTPLGAAAPRGAEEEG
ncbi:type VI secretion protein, partial [Burkholderia pseudomallei CS]|nr:type VI secretion protein [Burkholderia pseudomallei CS]